MKKETSICNHIWEDLYVFRSVDGKRLLQQRCKKCHQNRYVDFEDKTDQNSSKKD